MPKLRLIRIIKLHLILGLLLGLCFGIVYSLGGMIIDSLVSLNLIVSKETSGLSIGTLLAFGALLGMPLIGAILGTCLGVIEFIIYSVFSKWLVKFDLRIFEDF